MYIQYTPVDSGRQHFEPSNHGPAAARRVVSKQPRSLLHIGTRIPTAARRIHAAASPEPVGRPRRPRRLIDSAGVALRADVVEHVRELLVEREDLRRDVGLSVDVVGEAIAVLLGNGRAWHTWSETPL